MALGCLRIPDEQGPGKSRVAWRDKDEGVGWVAAFFDIACTFLGRATADAGVGTSAEGLLHLLRSQGYL